MAVQSFYISIEISNDEKQKVLSGIKVCPYKRTNDFIYRNTLYIDNIDNEEGCWWHINIGLYNFFNNVERLYELLQIVNSTKENFNFTLLGGQYSFKFASLLEFMEFIYPKVKPYKDVFEEEFGTFSIYPQQFFKVRRKNKKYYI